MKLKRTLFSIPCLIGAAVLTLCITGSASASHQWSKYHWEKKGVTTLNLDIAGNHTVTIADWPTLFGNVINSWNLYGGQYFSVSAVPPQTGKIESFNDNYGDIGWLGLASIAVKRGRSGHIVVGTSKVNDFYITLANYYGFDEPVEWEHVLCQEIGHTFGLHHNRNGAIGGEPDDTCMNDEQRPLNFPTPNIHDEEQLDIMYLEDHGDSTSGGGKPDKCNPKKGCAAVAHAIWAESFESEQDMFNSADLVVRATVISSSFNRFAGHADRAVPVTRVILKTTDTLKGQAGAIIILEQTRGPNLEIEDDPGYVSGDNYHLFLRNIGKNKFRIVNPDGRIKN